MLWSWCFPHTEYVTCSAMPTEGRLVRSVVKLYDQIYVNGASGNISTIWLMGGCRRRPVHTVGPACALSALSIQMKWDGKPPFIPSNIQATALGTASATPLSSQGTRSLCFLVADACVPHLIQPHAFKLDRQTVTKAVFDETKK